MGSLGSRLSHLLAVLIAVTVLTFSLVSLLPGDAATAVLGDGASDEDLAGIRRELGLDKPPAVRYVSWISGVITGDLGTSLKTGEKVSTAIFARLPVSIELVVMSQFIALALALPIGLTTAYRHGRLYDHITSIVTFAVMSVPSFALSLVLIVIFAVRLGYFPATGYVPISVSLSENLRSLFLPAMTLGLIEAALYTRVLRSEAIETLRARFILVAHAKGLHPRYILLRHALKHSSFTLITLIGVNIGNLFGGALIVESIFAVPGVGRLLVNATYARDLTMIQGVVLFIAVAYVITNSCVDALYKFLDPRVDSEARRR